MSKKLILLSTLAAVFMSGCASTFNTGESTFACEADNCPTPIEVYEGTHSSPLALEMGRTPSDWQAGGGKWKTNSNRSSKGADSADDTLTSRALDLASVQGARFNINGGQHMRPIREPSQVMRVWIAPWIDSQDNLHWTSYVFTEISPRRWSVGEQEVRHLGLPQISPGALR